MFSLDLNYIKLTLIIRTVITVIVLMSATIKLKGYSYLRHVGLLTVYTLNG